jgi:hypothetical protein
MFLFCGFAAMMTSRAERTIHLIGVSAVRFTPKSGPDRIQSQIDWKSKLRIVHAP